MSGLVNDGMDKGSMMESEDRIEKTVDIYITAEAVRDMKHKKDMEDFDSQPAKTQTPQHTGSDSVRNRSSRAAAVCLGLLCVLLLTAVIVLCVMFTQERQQFISKNENMTNERNQLISKNENLTNERNQLISKNENLTNERNQQISKNENLTNEREQLRNKLIILAGFTAGLRAGWTYYKSSLYYMSNDKKSWTESRRYCTERGADLIIINNREEQDFVMNMAGSGSGSDSDSARVWIGLTDRDVEGTWKWVDNSTLSDVNSTLTSGFRFWARTEPNSNDGADEDCALTSSLGYADFGCDYQSRWSCEKTIF